MRRPLPRRKPEPTIALINIVFLMLVFFMVAGTLAAPLDPELTLVNTRDLEGREPADALIVTKAGTLRFRGQDVGDPGTYLSALGEGAAARIIPDRAAPARAILAISRQIRAAGVEKVLIVTEKALQ